MTQAGFGDPIEVFCAYSLVCPTFPLHYFDFGQAHDDEGIPIVKRYEKHQVMLAIAQLGCRKGVTGGVI